MPPWGLLKISYFLHEKILIMLHATKIGLLISSFNYVSLKYSFNKQ